MFCITRISSKILWMINFFLSSTVKIYLLFFKKVDISFLATIKINQIKNFNFGKKIIIKQNCILDANKKSKIQLGNNVVIQENTYLLNYGGRGIYIGDNTNINKDCILYGHGGLHIGSNCLVAAKCVFIPAGHIFEDTNLNINRQGETRKGISIGNNVWIGTGVIVLDGVKIGNNSVIGAGSIVTKDIPSNSIATGIPAKVLRKRK